MCIYIVDLPTCVQDGYFGFKYYFKSLCDTTEVGIDFYHDFSSYLDSRGS